MSLIQNGKPLDSYIDIVLKSNQPNIISDSSHSNGVYYFEYSHKEGNDMYVIGYSSENCRISATGSGYNSFVFAYTSENVKLNDNESKSRTVNLNITKESGKRIGIGIDIEHKNVFYLYKNILRAFTYDCSSNNWKILIRETVENNKQDTVSIFLEDFEYDPPFGAFPWKKQWLKQTCRHNSLRFIKFHILSLIIFSF